MTRSEIKKRAVEAQEKFLEWAQEAEHGKEHQEKWFRMAITAGVDPEDLLEDFQHLRGLDWEEIEGYWERHNRNTRWTFARDWYRGYVAAEEKRQKDYKETVPTLEELRSDLPSLASWREAGRTDEDYISEYGEKAFHEQRPGSPEWRAAQYSDVNWDNLPKWNREDAKDYYHSIGQIVYSRGHVEGRWCWLGFVQDDAGNWRQVYGESPILAVYYDEGLPKLEDLIPADMQEAVRKEAWAEVARLAQVEALK